MIQISNQIKISAYWHKRNKAWPEYIIWEMGNYMEKLYY